MAILSEQEIGAFKIFQYSDKFISVVKQYI